MQKIVPNIWFNGNAKEAVEFYTTVFPNCKITSTLFYPEEGLADFQKDFAGKELTLEFEIENYQFLAINAGNDFRPNPSISFFVYCDSEDKVNEIWNKLKREGKELMSLQEYPFSKLYGWIEDKYGISWQLTLDEGSIGQKVVPSLLFVGENNGKAEEAIKFYTSIFNNSEIKTTSRYGKDEGGTEGTLNYSLFTLERENFTAMDSSLDHKFQFNEGVSLAVSCKDQKEIDYFWNKLTSEGGEESVCGWLKDKYGVSWQVAPENINELIENPAAFQQMMKQTKIIIEELEDAAKGE